MKQMVNHIHIHTYAIHTYAIHTYIHAYIHTYTHTSRKAHLSNDLSKSHKNSGDNFYESHSVKNGKIDFKVKTTKSTPGRGQVQGQEEYQERSSRCQSKHISISPGYGPS